jgi:hypothetical protein
MKQIFLALLMSISLNYFSQINVGTKESPAYKPGKFDQSQLDELKKSKTLFIYRTKDKDYLDTLKQKLQNVWKYTQIEFISFDEFLSNKYDESYSFLSITAIYYKAAKMGESPSFDTYLSLWKMIDGKKTTFCRINLYPTIEAFFVGKETYYDSNTKEDKFLKYMYEESKIYNWNLVYLENALQFVNDKLSKSETYPLINNIQDKDLSPLKNDTLYIPDYVLIKFEPLQINGRRVEAEFFKEEELLKNYPYPYRFVTTNELSKIISNSTLPIYYLSLVKQFPSHYLSIINSKTGEFIYSNFSQIGILSNDFDRIARLIKK